MSVDLDAIRAEHSHECAVCRYTVDGPCTVAVLLGEVERLRHPRCPECKRNFGEGPPLSCVECGWTAPR